MDFMMHLKGVLIQLQILYFDMASYLLFGLIVVGVLHLFFKRELVLRFLGGNHYKASVNACLLGVPLPLCSCGVIPTSVYLSKNGASKSAVLAFLVSTPQTGVDSIMATFGTLGPVFAVFRPFAAFIMGVATGIFTELFNKKDEILFSENEPETCSGDSCQGSSCSVEKEEEKSITRFRNMITYAFGEFLDDISVHFIVGLIIAALISHFIPDNFFAETSINSGLLGMIVVIVIGVPMYICATSSIPIAVALIMKGFSPGVAFVFLTVGPATNAATIAILLKAIGKKNTIIYLISIILGSVIFALLFDLILNTFNISINEVVHQHFHDEGNSLIKIAGGLIFGVLLIRSVYSTIKSKFTNKEIVVTEKSKTIIVHGMSCNHCAKTVTDVVMKLHGVDNVEIDLQNNKVHVSGNYDLAVVKKAIESAGYTTED